MLKYAQTFEENKPEHQIRFYGSRGHEHRIEGTVISPSKDVIKFISTLGENVAREHILYRPYGSSVTIVLDRKVVRENRLALRAESARDMKSIQSLEAMLRRAVQLK